MDNPFDDPDGTFSVLLNGEGQYSLWPDLTPAPQGWTQVHGPGPRVAMIAFIDQEWTDMRPASLVAAASIPGDHGDVPSPSACS